MYKNIIFYFTGTGNSLKIAKDIANIIGDCKLISIVTYNGNEELNNYDKIGFICPIYGFAIPNYVHKFISNINLPKNKYYFCIVNYADYHFQSITAINKLFIKKDIRLNSAYNIKMYNNYHGLNETEENIEKILEDAQTQIFKIGQKIKNMENIKVKRGHPFNIFSSFGNRMYKFLDKHFTISTNCSGCGNCSKLCPVKNISMENNIPKFHNNCELCVLCIHSCPNRAIDFFNRKQNRRRFLNREVKWEEILNGNN